MLNTCVWTRHPPPFTPSYTKWLDERVHEMFRFEWYFKYVSTQLSIMHLVRIARFTFSETGSDLTVLELQEYLLMDRRSIAVIVVVRRTRSKHCALSPCSKLKLFFRFVLFQIFLFNMRIFDDGPFEVWHVKNWTYSILLQIWAHFWRRRN